MHAGRGGCLSSSEHTFNFFRALTAIMMPPFDNAISRVLSSSLAQPTIQGAIGTCWGLTATGLSTAVATSLGWTDNFIELPSRPSWDPTNWWQFVKVFGRCLIVPAFAEEAVWRCLIHPHPTQYQEVSRAALSGFPIGRILAINLAFVIYHPLVADASYVTMKWFLDVGSVDRMGVIKVFRDPTFLMLAFVLGNSCSVAYWMAGGALYAPIIVHAVAVATWLEILGGEKFLRGSKSD